MPGDEPDEVPRKGTVMQIAITASARVIRAADITDEDEEEPDNA